MKKLAKVLVPTHIIAFMMAQSLSMAYVMFYVDFLHENKKGVVLTYLIFLVIPMAISYTLFFVLVVKKQIKNTAIKSLAKIDSYAFIVIAVALLLLRSYPEKFRCILFVECIVILLRVVSIIVVKFTNRIQNK